MFVSSTFFLDVTQIKMKLNRKKHIRSECAKHNRKHAYTYDCILFRVSFGMTSRVGQFLCVYARAQSTKKCVSDFTFRLSTSYAYSVAESSESCWIRWFFFVPINIFSFVAFARWFFFLHLLSIFWHGIFWLGFYSLRCDRLKKYRVFIWNHDFRFINSRFKNLIRMAVFMPNNERNIYYDAIRIAKRFAMRKISNWPRIFGATPNFGDKLVFFLLSFSFFVSSFHCFSCWILIETNHTMET